MSAALYPTEESLKIALTWARTHKDFKPNSAKAVEKIAKKTVEVAKLVVESQNFRTGTLVPAYIARKVREGLDPRILIATKEYLNSFKAEKDAQGEWAVLCDLEKMKRLEFGTRGKPGRPHWEPTILAMNSAAPILFAREVLKGLGLG